MIVEYVAIGTAVCILVAEWIAWELFRRRFAGICTLGTVDNFFFRFFSMTRVAILALLHTGVLLIVILPALLLLW